MEINVNEYVDEPNNIELNNWNNKQINSPERSQKNNRLNIHKILTILCCFIGIILSWSVSMSLALMVAVQTAVTYNASDSILSETDTYILNQLPPIHLPNLSNYSIYNIQCENRFVYEPKESVCYPPCNWDASVTGILFINDIVYFIISATALILCVGTLISWIVASVKCRGGKRGCDFQLARSSLFMVVLSKMALYIIYTCIDAIGRYGLVCRTNEFGESYLIAHVIFSVSSNPGTRLIINILGQFYTFWFLFSSLWTIFGFTNIFLLVFLSSRIRTTLKRQIIFFGIEMGIAIIFPICVLLIVTGLDPISTFSVNYLLQEVFARNLIVLIFITALPYSLTSGYCLTAVIIILTKLRFVSLRSEKITGQGTQLTELEKRMVIYAILLGLWYAMLGLNTGIYLLLEEQFITGLIDYTLCVNVNSLITLIPLQYTGITSNISNLNSTLPVYRGNYAGYLTDCEAKLSYLKTTVPIWCIVIVGVLLRIEGMLVFIVLIPRCSISCCRKLFSNKLTSWHSGTSRL